MDPLEVARAALRRAEQHVGVTATAPPVEVEDLAPPGTLLSMLPDGALPRGATTSVDGSHSLLLALLAQSLPGDQWCAIVGAPELGMLAGAHLGLDLTHVALVPDPGPAVLEVCAALIDGMHTVVVGPRVALSVSDQNRLNARAREREATLLTTNAWAGAAVTLTVDKRLWSGADQGAGYLRSQHLEVTRAGRANAAVPRRFDVTLGASSERATAQDVTRRAAQPLRLVS